MKPKGYRDVLATLRVSYDRGAAERDAEVKPEWKLPERAAFLDRLRRQRGQRLLEIGAGTGQDSLYFQDNGLSVVATDASTEMVARCREKGLEAHAMDFLELDFEPTSFDAIYAMNSLLHVSNADLPAVLDAIRALLKPGGLFFLGAYRGEDSEGPLPWDSHDPPRFFSLRRDETLQRMLGKHFEPIDFHVVELEDHPFQSVTSRRPT